MTEHFYSEINGAAKNNYITLVEPNFKAWIRSFQLALKTNFDLPVSELLSKKMSKMGRTSNLAANDYQCMESQQRVSEAVVILCAGKLQSKLINYFEGRRETRQVIAECREMNKHRTMTKKTASRP